VLGFNFVSLDLSQNDLRLNPLGFQITTYAAREDKIFSDNDDKKST
jgi:type IV secretory pathway component VirB8